MYIKNESFTKNKIFLFEPKKAECPSEFVPFSPLLSPFYCQLCSLSANTIAMFLKCFTKTQNSIKLYLR